MSNSYFQFKQFRIEQQNCAMKVSTDACIQGAWTPVFQGVENVLDIGSGTGLLSLMLAQRFEQIQIDAIEMDELAFKQSQENFQNSIWHKRIRAISGDVRQFKFDKKYDLIICNPPFFQNSLLGNSFNRNLARHQMTLGFDELFKVCCNVLNPNGYASVLLPVNEYEIWKRLLLDEKWSVFQELSIIPKREGKINRVVSLSSFQNWDAYNSQENLVIYEKPGLYTSEFSNLVLPFYL